MIRTIKDRTLLCATFLLVFSGSAHAQTGVSDDRVSLPEGPGSLEGLGENIGINPNMGQAAQSVSIPVPSGFAAVTPALDLSYSSGGGSSFVGMGWDLALPTIERMTSRGLPEYTDADLFAAGGSAQLVQVSDGEPAVYRARFEGGFVRYKWFNRGAGDEGYWVAEFPDGTRGFFGADAGGNPVPEARVGGSEGTFKYHMVEKVDVWGHAMRYDYALIGGMAQPVSVGWLFDGDTPRYEARFIYEDRPDIVSDARPGFELRLTQRLAQIDIVTQGAVIQSHALTYEDGPEAGGMSRLVRVERKDARGEVFPVVQSFGYSRALGGVCGQEPDCVNPYLVDMGSLGIGFLSGTATLIDINGDALPDVVDTSPEGAHRFFVNRFEGRDAHRFEAAGQSAVGTRSNHNLSAGNVQVIDVDGDGYADMLNTRTGRVLENRGEGDWTRAFGLFDGTGGLPDLATDLDTEDGDLTSIRFLDYDGDKRIDVMKSVGAGQSNVTQIFRNMPGGGFAQDPNVDALGVGFESERLQMADINGDGLLDPVELRNTSLSYRLNLGRGRWGAPVEIQGVPYDLDVIPVQQVEVEDLNNDAIADIVIVRGSQITYVLGQNNGRFSPETVITSETLGQPIPAREDTTTVLFADMNANGSSDVVWISQNGDVTFLDLFPVQPHLLGRVTNGLGRTTEVRYTTVVEAAAEAAAEGSPWETMPPFPSLVVASSVVSDAFSGLSETTEYTYRDGFYDGVEKQFRGFARTDVRSLGDESAEDSVNTLHYDLGIEDPYRAGLVLEEALKNDAGPLRTITSTYEDCPVAEVPAPEVLDFPIRHVCKTLDTTILQEGAPEGDWVTIEVATTFDGYGSVIREDNRGVTAIGNGGCASCERPDGIFGEPCGQTCQGDELIGLTETITPANNNDRWILGRPIRTRTLGRDGGQSTEKRYFYDGPAFEGLSEGQLTHGAPSRIEVKIEDGVFIPQARIRYDAHGNAVESINPTGSPQLEDDERRLQFFDRLGINLVAQEILLKTPEGDPYRLRQEIRYDDIWNRTAETTDWIVVVGETPMTPRAAESLTYDSFGQIEGRFSAASTGNDPQMRIRRALGSPISTIISETRSQANGPYDIVEVRCLDGSGRVTQSRNQIEAGRWLVSGLVVRNSRGLVHRSYARHESTSGECDVTPPEGVPFRRVSYDAAGRSVREVWVSTEGELERRTLYTPLVAEEHDEIDLDEGHPHFDTPVQRKIDGLGRQTALTRFVDRQNALTHRFEYDETGALHRFIDPEGNTKVQTYDLAGRLVEVDDPDRGVVVFTRDASGAVTGTLDAEGIELATEYDGLGRIIATYDRADPEGTRVTHRYDIPLDCPAEVCTNPANRLVERAWVGGDDWFGYGLRGEMLRTSRSLEGRRFEFEMTYDHALRLVRRVLPGGLEVGFEWDGASRATRIDGFADAVVTNTAGTTAEIHTTNGVRTSWDYDGAQRATRMAVVGPNDEILVDRRFTYDALDRITQIADEAAPSEGLTGNARYAFDPLGRLTEAHLDEGGAFEEVMRYTYDDIDNLLSKTSTRGADSPAHVGQMVYGGAAPHAVTEAGGMILSYDATGQMTARGDQRMTWDHNGRLARVVGADGAVQSERIFGPGQDHIIERSGDSTTWRLAEDFELRDGVATLFVEMGGQPMATQDTLALATEMLSDLAPSQSPDGQINAGDAWVSTAIAEGVLDDPGTDADPTGALLQAAVAALLTEEGQKTFVHADLIKSPLATTDADGQLIERLFWYPYGMARGDQSDLGARGFNNKRLDIDTGLVNFGARHLDPFLGRWISPDPAFLVLTGTGVGNVAEAMGAYTFVGNNPVIYHDNDGRFLVVIGIGSAVVLALALVAVGLAVKSFNSKHSVSSNNAPSLALGGGPDLDILNNPERYRAQKKAFVQEQALISNANEGGAGPEIGDATPVRDDAAAPAAGNNESRSLINRSSLVISASDVVNGYQIGGEGESIGAAERRKQAREADNALAAEPALPETTGGPDRLPPNADGPQRRRSRSRGNSVSAFEGGVPGGESARRGGRKLSRKGSVGRKSSRATVRRNSSR